MSRRKSEFPPNTFKVAEKAYRPVFADGGGSHYPKPAALFYKLVEMSFEKIDDKDYSTKASYKITSGPVLPHWGATYPIGFFHQHYVGDPKKQKLFNDLFNAVEEAIVQAHHAGIERGKNLLVRLSTGELTVKQFNDNALKKEDS